MKTAGVKRDSGLRRKKVEGETQEEEDERETGAAQPQKVHKFPLVLFGKQKDFAVPPQHHSKSYLSDYGSNNYPAVYCR